MTDNKMADISPAENIPEKPVVQKKERSKAQKEAFARCLATREKNLKDKLKAEMLADVPREVEKVPTPTPRPATPPPPEFVEPGSEASATRIWATPGSRSAYRQPIVEPDSDGDDGGEELFTLLDDTREQLKSVKQELDDLKAGHSALEDSFVHHHVKAANSIVFV
jgi:hypothetical protein